MNPFYGDNQVHGIAYISARRNFRTLRDSSARAAPILRNELLVTFVLRHTVGDFVVAAFVVHEYVLVEVQAIGFVHGSGENATVVSLRHFPEERRTANGAKAALGL